MTTIGLLVVGFPVLVWLTSCESRGDRATSLNVLIALILVDAVLFPKAGTANGAFQPVVGPITTSLPYLMVLVILFVRVCTSGIKVSVSGPGLAWACFLGWALVSAFHGHVEGFDTNRIVGETEKLVIYVAGVGLVAAGTSLEQLVGERGIPRLLRWASPVVLVLVLTELAKVHTSRSIGVAHLADTGRLGADFATIMCTLAVIGLAIALSQPAGRRQGLVPALICLFGPVFTGQRASLLALGASVITLVLLVGFARGHTMRLLPAERVRAGIGLFIVLGGIGAATVLGLGADVGVTSVSNSFTSQGKQDSAQARVNQWKVAGRLALDKPVLGNGAGARFSYVEPIKDAPDNYLRSDISHDVFLDQFVRSGLVGVGLFVLALGSSFAVAVRAGRRVRGVAASVGLAVAAGLVGLIARGTVESVVDKPRLAALLGLLIGLSAVCSRAAPLVSPFSQRSALPAGLDGDRPLLEMPR